MRVAPLSAAWLAAVLVLPAAAGAATFVELGDAGASLAAANPVDIADPDLITGTIASEDDADLFALYLSAGVPFTASSASSEGLSDSQLFLFHAAGRGLRYNDDIDTTNFLSSISFTATVSGVYYLGISGAGFNPQAGPAFIYVSDPFNPTLQAGPSAAGPLTGWAGVDSSFRDSGAYQIALTGAAPVPEPGPLLLVGLGLAALAGLRRFAL